MNLFKRPVLLYISLVLLIAIPLFTLPINLFPGEVSYKSGMVEVVDDAPLSLAYFIGMGYEQSEMDVITDFRLKPQGFLLAFLIVLGIPGLIAYRIHLKRRSTEEV